MMRKELSVDDKNFMYSRLITGRGSAVQANRLGGARITTCQCSETDRVTRQPVGNVSLQLPPNVGVGRRFHLNIISYLVDPGHGGGSREGRGEAKDKMRLCDEKSRVDGKSCVACPVMEHDLLCNCGRSLRGPRLTSVSRCRLLRTVEVRPWSGLHPSNPR
jgi:hypothetical protein